MIYEKLIKFSIASKIDHIPLLSKAIRAVCNTVVNDEIFLFNVELCMNEAIANVINHAYHRNPGNLVEARVTLNEEHVFIQIIDTGDKTPLPEPKKELNYDLNDLDTLRDSGMGLFLMYQLMDEVSFGEEEGKNVLTMKKYFNKKAEV